MLKKRAMGKDKWGDGNWAITGKRLETGYADNQPNYPFWVRPYNYDSTDWHKIGEWMVKTFGHSDWSKESAPWVGSNYKYWFRDEQDRIMFILKWS